jgi:hypothetical protein
MIERLVLGRAQILRDRFIPFVGIREDRVDIEDHAAKVEHPVADDIPDREPRGRDRRHRHTELRKHIMRLGTSHDHNVEFLRRRTSGPLAQPVRVR